MEDLSFSKKKNKKQNKKLKIMTLKIMQDLKKKKIKIKIPSEIKVVILGEKKVLVRSGDITECWSVITTITASRSVCYFHLNRPESWASIFKV